MIFLTVGTQFPFDRLVRAIDEAFDSGLVSEEVYAQIGETSYRPRNFESVVSLEKQAFDKQLKRASSVISHAGMGTITTALDNKKPLLVMPRLKKYDEVVNDHQLAIAKKFEQLGYVLAGYNVDELPEKIRQLSTFTPRERVSQAQLVTGRIIDFLNEFNFS